MALNDRDKLIPPKPRLWCLQLATLERIGEVNGLNMTSTKGIACEIVQGLAEKCKGIVNKASRGKIHSITVPRQNRPNSLWKRVSLRIVRNAMKVTSTIQKCRLMIQERDLCRFLGYMIANLGESSTRYKNCIQRNHSISFNLIDYFSQPVHLEIKMKVFNEKSGFN